MMMSATAAFQCPSTVIQSGTRSALNVGTNFDFSSTTGWENHYQGDDTVIEWHSSVQLKTIAELVPPESNNCLVVGCGNSNLPRVLYNMRRHLFITCLDSSPTCIDQLLVSYKLADSTRELLHHVGVESGLSWEFDLEGSNNRVSISMARKIH